MTKSAAHLRIIEETSAYWRVLFDNPPLNIVGARIYEDLQDLLARMDANPSLRVVVFESANPEFYLAHFDLTDTSGILGLIKTASLPSSASRRIAKGTPEEDKLVVVAKAINRAFENKSEADYSRCSLGERVVVQPGPAESHDRQSKRQTALHHAHQGVP